MSWNDGYERKMFAKRQEKQAAEYRALGMTEEQIQTMYEFDLEQFKSERRHRMHTQQFTSSDFEEGEEDDSESTLLDKFFDELICTIETSGDKSKYWWVEEIDDYETVKKIKALSERDLEILTLMVIDELKNKEVAQVTGIPLRTIERKKAQFKKLFKKF
jgi:DNA-directed RNA polymerase specialized sigma subunit